MTSCVHIPFCKKALFLWSNIRRSWESPVKLEYIDIYLREKLFKNLTSEIHN